jgi:hypothetical protein
MHSVALAARALEPDPIDDLSLATIPEIVWEAFLGLWLTFKGFSRSPVTSDYPRLIGVDGARSAATSAV